MSVDMHEAREMEPAGIDPYQRTSSQRSCESIRLATSSEPNQLLHGTSGRLELAGRANEWNLKIPLTTARSVNA